MIHTVMRAGLLLALWFSVPVFAASEPVGKVIAVSGEASVIRSGDDSRRPLAFKDPVFLNDRLVTGEDGQVKLLLNDDSVLKVSPTSELHVSEQLIGPGEESRTTINLLKGKLRSIVGKRLGANSRFEVHTGVAVAGVRGTDFEVIVDEETLVRCFSGYVEVSNIDPNVLNRVLLKPNMYTRIGKGQPPVPPVFIAPGRGLQGRPAGGQSGEAETRAEEGAGHDRLMLRELEQLGAGREANKADALPPLTDIFLYERPVFFGRVRQRNLYGDPTKGQIDIVLEPPQNAVAVPLDITVPAP